MSCCNHDFQIQIERKSGAVLRSGIRVQSLACSCCEATVERTIQSCCRCGCGVVTDGVALELPQGICLSGARSGEWRREYFCPECAHAELAARMPKPEPTRIDRQPVCAGNAIPPYLYRVRSQVVPMVAHR